MPQPGAGPPVLPRPRPGARHLALLGVAQAGMFVFGLVMALVGAVVPVLGTTMSLTFGNVGTLFLAMNAAMVLASLVVGLLVDRVGLKVTLAGGAALVAVALALIARAGHLAALLPAVACLGFGGGALNAGANTLVADLYEDEARKAAALNLLGVFFGFGALVLPFGIGALTAELGVPSLLLVAAAACAVLAVLAGALRFPAPKQRGEWPLAAFPRFARVPALRAIGLLLFFQSGNEFLLGGYVASFFTRESGLAVAAASYALAGYWAAMMLGRGAMSRILLGVDPWTVVLGGAAAAAAGALVVAASPTATIAIAGAIVTSLALSGIFPSVLGLTGARFSGHSGTVFGILFTVALCGGMTIPWMAGHLAEAVGLRAVFVLAAADFAAVGLLGALARRWL